jgi:ubiquinone/menaquinone biosynthesis C-methylase UbiE
VDKALQARGIKSGVLLELGCSAGNLSLLLAQKGFQAYGIDISPTAISWAKEKSREQDLDADFRVGNVLDLPYPSNFFDGIIDALCFHCIIGEDRPIFLANVFRVLKPRGLFIVMTKCGNPKEPNYLFDWTTRCSIVNGIATRYWGMPESILEEIRTAGFEVVNWKIYEYDQDQLFVEALKPLE